MNDKDWWNEIFWSSDDDWQREDVEEEDRNTLDDLTWMRDEIRYLEGKKP